MLDEEERQRTHGSQHQGLHDDWWHYCKHSNDRADQYWPHHQGIMLPTKKGKEQAEPTTVYTAIPNMAESLKSIMQDMDVGHQHHILQQLAIKAQRH
jgi:hypothetical protein